MGTEHLCISPVGARGVSGSVWQRRCKAMPIWNICPSTRPSFDRPIYKDRNLIERFFALIEQFKLAQSFLSIVHLACTIVRLA